MKGDLGMLGEICIEDDMGLEGGFILERGSHFVACALCHPDPCTISS